MNVLLSLLSCMRLNDGSTTMVIEPVENGEAVRWHGELTPRYDRVELLEERDGLPFYYATRGDHGFRAYFTVPTSNGLLFITLDEHNQPWIGYRGEDFPAVAWGGVVELADGQAGYLVRDSLGAVASSLPGPFVPHELEPTHVCFVRGQPVLMQITGGHRKFHMWGHEAL